MKILVVNLHPEKNLGGAEIQCDIIANHLVRFGHHVVYAAINASPGDVTPERYRYRVRFVPTITPMALLELMLAEEPDLVYWRLGTPFLPTMGTVSRVTGTRVVFSVSSPKQLEKFAVKRRYHPRDPPFDRFKTRILQAKQLAKSRLRHEWFRAVDGIVVLTKSLLPKVPNGPGFPTLVTQIYDSFENQREGDFHWPRPYVVWVANLWHQKNPELYIEAAERLSDLDVDFLMIGHIREDRYDYVGRGDLPTNVHYLGPKSPEHVNEILAGSELLAHTCSPEGFGNNFIQAWQQSRPTVTLYFDPDDLMKTHRVGLHSGTTERFAADIRRLLLDDQLRRGMGRRARAFATEYFDPEGNVRRFEAFFETVLAG